jgi:hypothetical protein
MTAIFDKLPPGIFGLPLDLLVGEDWEQSSVPAVWHLPRSLWDVIWGKGWTGLGERYGHPRHRLQSARAAAATDC